MAVYRFRVSFEDDEDVFRDIDIKSTQTFEDLHNIILVSINFENTKDASFFLSDDLWRKGEEIVLNKEAKKEKRIMSKSKISEFIEDPHQKFLYLFDYAEKWSFYVELIKILEEEEKISYPKCIKSTGIAPKQYPVLPPPPNEENKDDEEDVPKHEKIFTSEETYEDGDSKTEEEGEPAIGEIDEGGIPEEGEIDENANAEEEL